MNQEAEENKRSQYIGMAFTIVGATLWGLSGTCVQFIESVKHVNLEWLLTVRLTFAGLFTLVYSFYRARGEIFRVFTNKKDVVKLLIFGMLGLAMCQYTYFRAIKEAGVGVATVLQYLAPTMIIVYLFMRYRKQPSVGEALSVLLALVGTVLIVFSKGFDLADINTGVLFWGLLSAIGICVYSLQPVQLLHKYGTGPIVGFAMLISGIGAEALWGANESHAIWDLWTWGALFCIIILGTVISFNAYMEGVRRIGAVQGSILSSIEPISAAYLGWLLLNNTFNAMNITGFILILSTVFILGDEKSKQKKTGNL